MTPTSTFLHLGDRYDKVTVELNVT